MIRTVALAAFCAFALPALAQEKPAVVFQAQSPAALLSHVREVVKTVGGAAALDEFEKHLKDDLLGEEGFQGLNLTQPIAGYARLDGKPEETAFVLVIPISTEKEFLALLERADVKLAEVEDDKGAYRVGPDDPSMTVHLRLTATHAYVAVGGSAKTIAVKALVPAKDLIDAADTGLFALHAYPDRASDEYRKLAQKGLDKLAADENLGENEVKWVKVLKQLAEVVLTQTERITLRGDLDPGTKMAALDLIVAPKKNSLLSLGFAVRKPAASHFAGAVKPDLAQSMLLAAPAWSPEVSAGVSSAFLDFGKFLNLILGPGGPGGGGAAVLLPALDALVDGMAAAAKDGTLEFASVTTAPTKAGTFSNAFGVRVKDAAAVDKELRALAKSVTDTNPAMGEKITLDAAKHAGAAIHTMALGDYLDKPLRDTFGAGCTLAMACGKDAVYLAIGSTAVEGVKLLLDAKPGAAPPFEMSIRPTALANVYRGMGLMEAVEKALGTGDASSRMMALTATSTAAELRVRVEVSLPAVRLMVEIGTAKPVPAP